MKNLVILALMAGAAFGVLNFHFILFDDSVKVLQKSGLRMEHTFVDARGNKALKLLLMPDLIAAGFKDALREVEQEVDKHTEPVR
ncbi:MAG: hypothetical protein OEV64_14205 [Desulfobulbaceae bacterium]|nr:hypothetical protein [Desulfobulbaceae bacterium]